MRFYVTVRERREYAVDADTYEEVESLFMNRNLDKSAMVEWHDALVQVAVEVSGEGRETVVLYENDEPGTDAKFHDSHPVSDDAKSRYLVAIASV